MARLIFIYRSTKKEANLTARLIVGKFSKNEEENTEKIMDCKTNVIVSKEYWENYLRQTTKKQGKLYKANQKKIKDIHLSNFDIDIRSELNKIKNYVLIAAEKMNASIITKEWLANILYNYYNQDPVKNEVPKELVRFVDYYIDQKKDEITPATIKKHNVIKHKLERYESSKRRTFLLSDIDENFKFDFIEYCKGENYAMSTIQRDLVFIKTYCNHAYEKGLDIDRSIKKFRIKVRQETKHPYLTPAELEKIEKHQFNESLDNVRDWLIISCNTGQRISDFMDFNTSQIRTENEKHYLEFKQKKTNKLMTIPLFDKVIEILNKRNWNFPNPISDQKYNEYLKVVCKEAGINEKIKGSKKEETEPESGIYRKKEGVYEKWELVSSHIGRRSFATNFYGLIPTNYLTYMTGHSTEEMFLQYIGKSNKDLAVEIFNYL